jgi:poly(A) polymerase
MHDPAKQRDFALDVVRKLRAAGYIAYWAGGCVRDQLLGRVAKDYDVATDAQPDQIREVFGRRRTLAIGAAFGVISVIGPRDAGQVEVTTFRRDAAYSDGRHPDSVSFSGPEEDARRRDFTINGLFYDPLVDEVIDYVAGREDLARRVVRAIGEPHERFAEDKLRMLRAARFTATFGFQLDPATSAAIKEMAAQINVVSAERIALEMRQMLVHPSRTAALVLLLETGLLEAVLPEAVTMRGIPQGKPVQPEGDLRDHTLLVLANLRSPSFTLALAALLHDIGKPQTMSRRDGRLTFYDHELVGEQIAENICRRWKLSNKETERVAWLVRYHMYLGEARNMRWAKLQRMLTQEGIEELLDLHEADALASDGNTADIEYCRQLLKQPPEELNPSQLLTGHDLLRHGVPQGKHYKWLLERVRDAQLEKTIRGKRDALALVDRLLAEGIQEENDPPSAPVHDDTVMMLTIEYTAQVRRAAGVASETLEIKGDSTLDDLVRRLVDRHGDELRRMLLDSEGRLQRSILVFVDEAQVAGGDAKLRDGQTVTLVAPISGG